MSPPPRTRGEYSRGDGGSRGSLGPKTAALALPLTGSSGGVTRSWRRPRSPRIRFPRPIAVTLVLGALISAGVLIVAEFLTLYAVRVIRGSSAVPPVAAGAENHYALIPIALLGLVLVLAALRLGDRWALSAVAILGLIALLIGLVHDLPDARRTGLVGSLHIGWVRGASSPSIGMYMETLGAVMLLLTAGLGLLFGEPIAVEAPVSRQTPVPFGVEPTRPAAEVALAPSGNGTSGAAAEVVAKPPARRPQSRTAKRSPATPRKRSPAAPRKPAVTSASATPAADASGTLAKPPVAKRSPSSTAKRSPSTPAKRSPSPTARRSQAAGKASAAPAAKAKPPAAKRSPASATKRSPSPAAKRPTSPPSAQHESAGPAKPPPSGSTKRAPSGSTKRAPGGATKRATGAPAKRSPSAPRPGATPTPRSRPRPKRSES